MSDIRLTSKRVRRLSGFGESDFADAYTFQPKTYKEIRDVLALARNTNRQVTLRGSGRSYGDAAYRAEAIVLDLTRFKDLTIDLNSGLASAQAGVTIEDLWRTGLPLGFWPPVVSGTMYPTIGGALAMNIHGKNAFVAGTLGDHVTEIEFMDAGGIVHTIPNTDGKFRWIVSGAGLFGIILSAKIQLHRVTNGELLVTPHSCKNWDEMFSCFEEHLSLSDYMVGWIDAFARGNQAGRGVFHHAIYSADANQESLQPEAQDLPSKIAGMVPKSHVWRVLKLTNNRPLMRLLNTLKFHSDRRKSGSIHHQSLVAFSFLLDYVPGWQRAYAPHGLIQYQSFVPADSAKAVFSEQIRLQQAARYENFLTVIKRHKRDRFGLSHAVDGYSLAQDFKVIPSRREELSELCHHMSELVTSAGGRFYFAKDSLLRPQDVSSAFGPDALGEFRAMKTHIDPTNLFSSSLAKRVGLDSP